MVHNSSNLGIAAAETKLEASDEVFCNFVSITQHVLNMATDSARLSQLSLPNTRAS